MRDYLSSRRSVQRSGERDSGKKPVAEVVHPGGQENNGTQQPPEGTGPAPVGRAGEMGMPDGAIRAGGMRGKGYPCLCQL